MTIENWSMFYCDKKEVQGEWIQKLWSHTVKPPCHLLTFQETVLLAAQNKNNRMVTNICYGAKALLKWNGRRSVLFFESIAHCWELQNRLESFSTSWADSCLFCQWKHSILKYVHFHSLKPRHFSSWPLYLLVAVPKIYRTNT
jgi:hypothetical protein